MKLIFWTLLAFLAIYASDLLLNIFNNPQKAGGVNHGLRSDFYKIQIWLGKKTEEQRTTLKLLSMESFLHDKYMTNYSPLRHTHIYQSISGYHLLPSN